MKKPKIFIVSQPFYIEPFLDLVEVVDSLRRADMAMFTGGEDVDPSLYNQPMGRYTYSNLARDRKEALIYAQCQDFKLPTIGICRGSQFLTVQNGGRLVQDVTNHNSTHEVFTDDGRCFLMSSTHHQMMNPFDLPQQDYHIHAWAEGRSVNYLDGWNKNIESFKKRGVEPEVVWYPRTKTLCVQPHPEIMRKDSPGVQYCRDLFVEYFCN